MADSLLSKLQGIFTHGATTDEHLVQMARPRLVIPFSIPAALLASSGVVNVPLFRPHVDISLTAAGILPAQTVATHATNTLTAVIAQGDIAATALTDYDSYHTNSSGGAAFTAMTLRAWTIVASTDVCAAGEVLYLEVTGAGTAPDLAGAVILEYTQDA